MSLLIRILSISTALWAASLQAAEWQYVNPIQTTPGTTAAASTAAVAPEMEVPTNNMSMEKVKRDFGQPNLEMVPVGEPPITRWLYSDYTVYFEFDRVIISVMN